MHDETFHTAMVTLFDTIADAFGARDLPRFRACYRFPCQVVTAQGAIALGDPDAFARLFAPMLERLQGLGFARSVYHDLRCVQLGAAVALASMRWTRHRADDTVIETLGATYTLTRDAGGWGIVALLAHDADTLPVLA